MARAAFDSDVLRVGADTGASVHRLLARFDLELTLVGSKDDIPASFWGAPEAGIAGHFVYARADTPLHSILHEAAHVICMSGDRRALLNRDAGGDDLEEAAVCYLQIVLADFLPGVGRERLMRDMDAWGYSFRLGSTTRWFAEDAADARTWLEDNGLLTARGKPCWTLRR